MRDGIPGTFWRPLQQWLDDPERVAQQLLQRPAEVPADTGVSEQIFGLPREDRIVAVVMDGKAKILASTDNFEANFAAGSLDPAAVSRSLRTNAPYTTQQSWGQVGTPQLVTYAPVNQAHDWALPAHIQQALTLQEAACVCVTLVPASASDALQHACAALGLTKLQATLAIALVRYADLRHAAQLSGITYATARKVISEAMKRAATNKMSAFVAMLIRLSFGVWPTESEGDRFLKDIYGLSPREAALTLRIANGMSRSEAAKATSISDAVAKKHIDRIYSVLGARSAAGLAAAVTDMHAASMLTSLSKGAVLPMIEVMEPLRLIRRADGGWIAISDYGPKGARPVLIVHPSTSGRHAPMALVKLLQGAGFRPFAIDRPGYGLSSPPHDRIHWRQDPFTFACHDVLKACEQLAIETFDLIGRGGAQFVAALMHIAPERVGSAVLVNPDPPTRTARYQRGLLGAIKRVYAHSPSLIETLSARFASFLSDETAPRIMERVVADSPPDRELMSNPENLADFIRGYRLFASGRVEGYVREQLAMIAWKSAPLAGQRHWKILVSETDPLHDPAEVRRFCEELFPDTPVSVVPNTGRFLIMSRPDLVVAELLDSRRRRIRKRT